MIDQGEIWDGKNPIPIARGRVASAVARAIDTIADVIKSSGELFTIKSAGNHKWVYATELGKSLIQCFNIDVTEVAHHLQEHKFNPLWELFLECSATISHIPSPFPVDRVAELEYLAKEIRRRAKQKDFIRMLDNERRTMAKNQAKLVRDIARLRKRYRRILAIRLDLLYRSDFDGYRGAFNGEKKDYGMIARNREAFLRYLRRGGFGNAFLWYAWKQETGVEKGPHTHVLIFLDGKKLRNDSSVAYVMGRYWVDVITKGEGVAFNCNARKRERYRRVAIGQLKRDDDKTYQALHDLVVTYITKTDYYFRYEVPDSRRAFGRSALPLGC
ncbi:inovirus Gp2 family protein [Xanthomonas campestris pv. badrii]|uniref:Inovirus Gp2 family protein n=1 Tax=Xanthomonas campestris pv. badrii TaxID=149696 RepID=A0A7Z2VCD1_XANCA|nr:inovirus-type Gp2 protein [Xanthomonas campestris]QJD69051.1 inovirus Gp2 family protein [Xanthomonas campestris pv. badrii]